MTQQLGHIITHMKRMSNFVHEKIQSETILTKETILFILFIFGNIAINTNKLYVALVICYSAFLFAVNRRAIQTLWIVFVSTMLFFQAKYFINTIFIPSEQTHITLQILYKIMFSDIFLLLILYFIQKNRNRYTDTVKRFEILFIPIMFIGIISSWISYYSDISFFYFIQLVKLFLIYFVSKTVLTDRKLLRTTIEIFMTYALFNGVLMCMQKIKGSPFGFAVEHLNAWAVYGRYAYEQSGLYRPGGISDDPNLMATAIGTLLPIAYILGITKNDFNRIFIWITIIISIAGLVFTGSRAVWIIVLCVFIVMLTQLRKKYHIPTLPFPQILKRKSVLLIIACILVPFIFYRLSSLPSAMGSDGSGTYRLRHIQIALDYIKNNPFGIGLYVFQYLTPTLFEGKDYSYIIAEPHNMFAQIGSELGIFGLLLFSYLLFRIISTKYAASLVHKTPLTIGIVFGCICYIGISNFYPWFIYAPVSEIFWILLGIKIYDEKNSIDV